MKWLIFFACFFPVYRAQSQMITIRVDTIHMFRHPAELSTNDAIDQGKVEPGGYHTVSMEFRIDLDRKIMTRRIDSASPIDMPIVYLSKREDCYNIVVRWDGKGKEPDDYPNYTLALMPGGKYVFELRILEQNEITGWFTETVKVDVERGRF